MSHLEKNPILYPRSPSVFSLSSPYEHPYDIPLMSNVMVAQDRWGWNCGNARRTDTRAEIDVVEALDEMYRIHVTLLMANDHVGQVVLVYILYPTWNRSFRCTERPLVAARYQIETHLHDLCCFRLPASWCLVHFHLLLCTPASYHLARIIFKFIVPDLLVRIVPWTKS